MSQVAPDLDSARAHLRGADPVLRRLIDADPTFNPRAWLQQMPAMDAFGALIFQVVGQQLSVAATRRLLDRIQERFNGHLPSPREVLDAPAESLHLAGLSRRKTATIRAIAAEFASHRLDQQQLQAMSDEDIERLLTEIPGVGPWTVHGFLILALDRQDVVLPGDLALRKAIERNYTLDHTPSPDEVLRIAEPWRPYRSLATAYMFATAFNPSHQPGANRDQHQGDTSPRHIHVATAMAHRTEHPHELPDRKPFGQAARHGSR